MNTTTSLSTRPIERSAVDQAGMRVEQRARTLIAHNCPYSFYFKDIDIDFDDGTLILQGRVPTFYLKQILQAWLVKVGGVERIENRVEVVSATGLSSVGGH